MLRVVQAAPPAVYEQPLYLALADCLDAVPVVDAEQKDYRLEIPVECPELAGAMSVSPLIRRIEMNREAPVSIAVLWQLHNLLTHANYPELNEHRLGHDDLAAILHEAYLPRPEAGKTLWQLFMEWLRSKFQGEFDNTYLQKIIDWLAEHLPVKTLAEYLTYGSILLLLVLVAGLLVYQLYEARVIPPVGLSNWRRRFRRHSADDVTEEETELHALKTLPLNLQPGAILSWCVQRMLKLGLLTDVRDRTNRELLELLKESVTASIAASFQSIMETAERSVYGNIPPGEEQVALLYTRAEIFSAEHTTGTSRIRMNQQHA